MLKVQNFDYNLSSILLCSTCFPDYKKAGAIEFEKLSEKII